MKNKITATEFRKKFFGELLDLLASSAFPLMLMIILCATIISYVGYGGDLGLGIVVLVIGEVMLIVATVIFGKQNGTSAYKKYVSNESKRRAGSTDYKATLYVGEYKIYKGVIIGLIVCIPLTVVTIIQGACPNEVCKFILMYVFGWAYFPFALARLSSWFTLIMVIPYVAVHTIAYIWGAKVEEKKQQIANENENIKGKPVKK